MESEKNLTEGAKQPSEKKSKSSEKVSRRKKAQEEAKAKAQAKARLKVQRKKAKKVMAAKKLKRKQADTRRSKPFTVIMLLFLMVIIVSVFAVAGAAVGAYVAIIQSIPDLGLEGIQPRTYTTVIYNNNGAELSKLHGEENREYATLENIPKNMQNAIMAIEDERFYIHDGVDMRGILRAAYATISGKQLQGGSTITQQLIKNTITQKTHNDFKSKLKEIYLALKYEKELNTLLGSKEASKDYIMELYLNTIPFGHGYSGIQVASEGYFGKEAKDLDLAECACLAGITNNPTKYSPRSNPEKNKERQTIILNYMLAQGLITQQEYDAAIVEDVYAKIKGGANIVTNSDGTSDVSLIHSYYEDALIDQISEDLQRIYNMSPKQAANVIYNGGLQIYSNFDPRIQKIVDTTMLNDSLFPRPVYSIDVDYRVSTRNNTTNEETNSEYRQFTSTREQGEAWVASKRAEIEASLPADEVIFAENASYTVQPQCSMAIIDYHTGEIKAVGGGRGKKTVNRGFNRATDSKRQPGSVFKILAAYTPALDLGKINAATNLVDEPYSTADKYTPRNWWGKSYRGAMSVRTAIMDSANVVAVKTMVETGIDVCYDYLLNYGFTTLSDDNHAATALGGLSYGVTQVELAAAYGTIANGGQYLRPMFYSKVLDHDGNVLLENRQEPVQVLKPSTSYIITQLMTSVINDGTGTAAKFTKSKMPLAGKTGTTTDSKDLTFVGYTPYYVASIWYGFDRYDNDKVESMDGFDQKLHMNVWRTVMEQVNEGLEVKDFEVPDGVVKAKVCRYTGMQAGANCPAVEEYFVDNETIHTPCTMNHGIVSNVYANKPGYYELYYDKNTIRPIVPAYAPKKNTGSSSRNTGNTQAADTSSPEDTQNSDLIHF